MWRDLQEKRLGKPVGETDTQNLGLSVCGDPLNCRITLLFPRISSVATVNGSGWPSQGQSFIWHLLKGIYLPTWHFYKEVESSPCSQDGYSVPGGLTFTHVKVTEAGAVCSEQAEYKSHPHLSYSNVDLCLTGKWTARPTHTNTRAVSTLPVAS